MGFFSTTKKKTRGLLSIGLQRDGVVASRVSWDGGAARPVVKLCAFYAAEKTPLPALLEKVGKDVHANTLRCAHVLGGGEYQLLSVEAPNVPAEELVTAVRWRLKDLIDFPVEQATVDVLGIPADQAAQGRGAALFAIAARSSLIAERQNLFADAAVPLAVIDIPEMAQRNMSALIAADGRGLAMLSFHADGGLLTVTYNGELYLSRRIDATLDHVREPDSERRQASYDKITLELQRSLDHFDRQFHFINVSRLVLAPTGASGLDEYLSSNLYTPVDSLDLAQVFDLGLTPELANAAQQQRFFLTLGAALRREEAGA